MHEIDIQPQRVIVYEDRARITRRGPLSRQPGIQTVIVSNLPYTLEPKSVRARCTGAAVIRNVDLQNKRPPVATEEEIEAAQHTLDTLLIQQQILRDEGEVLQAHVDFLQTFRDKSGEQFASAIANDLISLESVTAVAHYITGQMGDTYTRRRQISKEQAELDEKISQQKRLLRRLKREPETEYYELQLLVDVKSEEACQLEVEYVARAARWRPHYDIRLQDDGTLELSYLASVTQRTGEDWQNVELTLSTARPALSAMLPELEPWILDEEISSQAHEAVDSLFSMVEDTAVQGAGAFLGNGSSIGQDGQPDWLKDVREVSDEREDKPSPVPGAPHMPEAPDYSQERIVNYLITNPVSITADGTTHRNTIAVRELQVALDHIAAPKLVSAAYLRATITNNTTLVMLPGEATIFNGTEFVGHVNLDGVGPDECFIVQMGVDNQIHVNREMLSRKPGQALTTTNRCTDFTFRITVTNNRPDSIELTVSDQLPLSKHNSIKARLKDSEPRPKRRDTLNTLEWTLSLEPQESQEITFTFSVDYPLQMKVQGLDL